MQRSIIDVSKYRAEVLTFYKRGLNLKEDMGSVMLGRSGLAMARDGMKMKLFFRIGVCVSKFLVPLRVVLKPRAGEVHGSKIL